MGWISRLFSSSKTASKKQYTGWSEVKQVLILFDEYGDSIQKLADKWAAEGKSVNLIQWKTPAPKKDQRVKFFTEKNIRFGKITNPEFDKNWNNGLLIDLTTSSHKRLQRLLEFSTFDFMAGINPQHKVFYDLFTPYASGKFESCLNTIESYIKIINSNKKSLSL
ncbi:MAG: hypothetical protein LAT54_05385 [Cryomorphaceae bacterium]|nr:hypothetical protein [Cryomorphaceae bacterium]